MKSFIKSISVIALATCAQAIYAAEITDIYTTGDTLTAQTLDTIKAAVNDNNSQINAIILTPGPQGETGPQGPMGETGPAGADGQDAPTPIGYTIGSTGPAGGIVFYVDGNGQHGLEAAPQDYGEDSQVPWTLDGDGLAVKSIGNGIGAGLINTMLILTSEPNPNTQFAAGYAMTYYTINNAQRFSDWYLPSITELQLMMNTIGVESPGINVGGISNDPYWSSNEASFNDAHRVWRAGAALDFASKTSNARARFIRKF